MYGLYLPTFHVNLQIRPMDAQIAQGALLLDPLQLASELPGKVAGPS